MQTHPFPTYIAFAQHAAILAATSLNGTTFTFRNLAGIPQQVVFGENMIYWPGALVRCACSVAGGDLDGEHDQGTITLAATALDDLRYSNSWEAEVSIGGVRLDLEMGGPGNVDEAVAQIAERKGFGLGEGRGAWKNIQWLDVE